MTEELKRGVSGSKIWDNFNDFQAYLYDEIIEKDGHNSVDNVQVSEVIHHMEHCFADEV